MTDYTVIAYPMITAVCPECDTLLRVAENRDYLECANHHCDNTFLYLRPIEPLFPVSRDSVDA